MSLNPQQFRGVLRDEVPVDGYDPDQVGPADPTARFQFVPSYPLDKLGVEPATGADHDAGSGINDSYYSDMEAAIPHAVPGIVVHEKDRPELLDGHHRSSIALAKGITHLPAWVHK